MMKTAASIIYPERITFIALTDHILYPQAENQFYVDANTTKLGEQELLNFIVHFNWTYIALVNFDKDEVENLIHQDIWKFFAFPEKENNLCVVYETVRNKTDALTLREKIISDSNLEIIIIFGNDKMKIDFLYDFLDVKNKIIIIEVGTKGLSETKRMPPGKMKFGLHVLVDTSLVLMSYFIDHISNSTFLLSTDPWLKAIHIKYGTSYKMENFLFNNKEELDRSGKSLSVLSCIDSLGPHSNDTYIE